MQGTCASKDQKRRFGTQLFISIVEHETMACYLWLHNHIGCSFGEKKSPKSCSHDRYSMGLMNWCKTLSACISFCNLTSAPTAEFNAAECKCVCKTNAGPSRQLTNKHKDTVYKLMLHKTSVTYKNILAIVAIATLQVVHELPTLSKDMKAWRAQHWPIREEGHNM